MTQDVFLVEIDAYVPGTGVVTHRYATGGHVTGPAETPPNTFYDPRVRQALKISRSMFAPNTTRGSAQVGIGDIELLNGNKELDPLLDYGIDGRTVTVRRGLVGAAYPAGFPVLWAGTARDVEAAEQSMLVKLRDRQSETNIPLQPTKYAGSGLGTLEGTEDDLKGKPKPICYGQVFNVAPPCVETAKLIHHVADAEVASIPAVYDRGVLLKQFKGPFIIACGGTTGRMWGSGDGGATWAEITDGFTQGLQDNGILAYGDGLWIEAGGSTGGIGRIQKSTDGVTWTVQALGGDGVDSVAYGGNGRWVLTGDRRVLFSLDHGETWTTVPTAAMFAGLPILEVKYLNGLFILTSQDTGTVLWYSADAINWTAATIPSMRVFAAGYGADVYVIAGDGLIYTSDDLLTWTSRTRPASHPADSIYRDIIFAESQFVLVGFSFSTTAGLIATSPTGTAWTAQTPATAAALLRQITHDGSTFVVVGRIIATNAFYAETSPDAVTWTTTLNVASADTVCLTGVAFGYGGPATVDYASEADLLDDAEAPPPGEYRSYLSAGGSYFRLGATPDGLVTADVTQGAAASDRTTAQIWEAILDERAGMASGDWNATDVTDLDALDNAVIGYWTDQEVQISAVLDLVAGSLGAAWYLDAGGVFRIKQLLAPTGTPVASFTANDLKPLVAKLPNDLGQGIPQWRTVLRYAKNYTVQTTDVAAAVSDARRAFLAKEWRDAVDEDATVQTKHLLAPEAVEDTLLAEEADAAAEASRRQTLRGVRRRPFELVVKLNDDTVGIDLNDVIELTHERYGLSGGELFRVLDLALDAAKGELVLTAWG